MSACVDGGVDTGVVVLFDNIVGVFNGIDKAVGVLLLDIMDRPLAVYPVGVGIECVVDGVDTVVAGDTGVPCCC